MLSRDADALIFTGDHNYADQHLSNATDDQLNEFFFYYPGQYSYFKYGYL